MTGGGIKAVSLLAVSLLGRPCALSSSDRTLDSESRGGGFESHRAHKHKDLQVFVVKAVVAERPVAP